MVRKRQVANKYHKKIEKWKPWGSEGANSNRQKYGHPLPLDKKDVTNTADRGRWEVLQDMFLPN